MCVCCYARRIQNTCKADSLSALRQSILPFDFGEIAAVTRGCVRLCVGSMRSPVDSSPACQCQPATCIASNPSLNSKFKCRLSYFHVSPGGSFIFTLKKKKKKMNDFGLWSPNDRHLKKGNSKPMRTHAGPSLAAPCPRRIWMNASPDDDREGALDALLDRIALFCWANGVGIVDVDVGVDPRHCISIFIIVISCFTRNPVGAAWPICIRAPLRLSSSMSMLILSHLFFHHPFVCSGHNNTSAVARNRWMEYVPLDTPCRRQRFRSCALRMENHSRRHV